jgi:indolepyruvate ferredoxin oxidoreductase alpha subunit
VDAFNVNLLKSTIKNAVDSGEPSVVIARGECPINMRVSPVPMAIDKELCNDCHLCLGVGCPAISLVDEGTEISSLCIGNACGVCAQVCPRKAITDVKNG